MEILDPEQKPEDVLDRHLLSPTNRFAMISMSRHSIDPQRLKEFIKSWGD